MFFHKKCIHYVLILGMVLLSTVGGFSQSKTKGFVAMLLPENLNPRWEGQDAVFFKQWMKKLAPRVKVEVFNANNDSAAQQRQAEQAITRGADVLVVLALDGEAAGIIADIAVEDKVPVVAYDRMVQSKHTALWIQASMRGIGRAQAQHVIDHTKQGDTIVLLKGSPTDPNAAVIYEGQMEILKPFFNSGKRILGYENWTQFWDPTIARRSMDQALTKLNNKIQGVVSSNDGNAAAAIAALEEQGLAGKVAVSGLDATIQALQLILLGKQTESIWRPFNKMAEAAAKASLRLINKQSLKDMVSETVTNTAGGKVGLVAVPFHDIVGEKGVEFVIENDSTISKQDVCKGAAASTAFCKR